MGKRPNKLFIVLSLIMVFMFIPGVISVFLLNCCQPPLFDSFTGNAIAAQNSTVGVLNLTSTQTQAASIALTLTPACYTIDIVCPGEPTLKPEQRVLIMMASAESTEYYDLAATATALAPVSTSSTNTPPYEPTRYAQRQATLAVYATAAGPATYVLYYMEETRIVSEYLGTPSPTPSTVSAGSGNCAWQWARQALPEITSMAQIALNMHGIQDSEARAEAYGETCASSQGGNFAAMTTDFYITLPVERLPDDSITDPVYLSIYQALIEGLTLSALPAPLGYLDVTFTDGTSTSTTRAMFSEIRATLEAKSSG